MATTLHERGLREVVIPLETVELNGELAAPANRECMVIFAHSGGSGRRSPRNQFVARHLRRAGLGTFLFDLLTGEEEALESRTGHLGFNIGVLADRLAGATRWLTESTEIGDNEIGYFGASTGAAAALIA